MGLRSNAKLVKWNWVSKTLHYRVKKACVSRILHSKTHFLTVVLHFHQFKHLALLCFLDIALEVAFVFLSLFPFHFKFSPSIWWYGLGPVPWIGRNGHSKSVALAIAASTTLVIVLTVSSLTAKFVWFLGILAFIILRTILMIVLFSSEVIWLKSFSFTSH